MEIIKIESYKIESNKQSIFLLLTGLCNGGHEWHGCGSFCDVECGKIGEDCPIVNIKCTDRCYCDPGYARDEFCNCVPFDKCDDC